MEKVNSNEQVEPKETPPRDSREWQKLQEAKIIAADIMHDYLKAKGRI